MSAHEDYLRRNVLEQDPAILHEAEIQVFFEDDENLALRSKSRGVQPLAPDVHQSADDDWPRPEPLGGELPPVQACDIALLPNSLRAVVEDTAERMQVPLDYPAVVAVLCLAGVTSRRATIQPKAEDTSWVVVPNLWGGIIAPPGLMKSPVISTITRPLARIEADWRADYETAASAYAQQQEEAELRRSAWREQYKASQKKGKAAPARPDDSLAEPVSRRLITQDATAEKLHEILRDNPAGVLMIRDELSGWLATLDKPGREGERGFFLSAWNGDTGYTMDRIGRGSIHVDACCVSMLGGIQPARLRSYLVDALQDGPMNDGLLQRFQVLVYPDISQDWRYVDRAPRSEAISDAQHIYHRLAHLDAAEPLRLRFDPDAQELFVAWLTDLEGKLRCAGLHPALASHLAKYRSLMPALALLFELADGGTEIVSLEHARQSAGFCDYLESHALRIYSMLLSPERQAAADLGRRLAEGWKRCEGLFTARDVYQNDWRDLTTPEAVRKVLDILEDAGWVRRVPLESKTTGGRPRELYAINPKIWRAK
jgi:putative DNA primase/helicase